MFQNPQRVLILCAHPDDELTSAGLLMRLLESGAEVRYQAFSRCETSIPAEHPRDIVEQECRAAAAMIGLSPEAVEVHGFPVRHFPSVRQEILEHLVALRRDYQPELVLLPASTDTHQDHGTIAAEGFRAFKHTTLLGYEHIQNARTFSPAAFVPLTDAVLQRKVEAMQAYASQGFRPYASEEYVRGLAKVRGIQAGVPYAEAFEVQRLYLR